MNYMISNLVIKLRNFYINNFKTNIVGFVNYKNEIILSKPRYIYFLNLFPFVFVISILNFFKIICLIEKDNLYFLQNKKVGGIVPMVMNLWIKNNENTFDFKKKFDKYGNNVPIDIIFKNENIFLYNEDEIIIKYLKSGKFLEKSFNYKKIKLFSKIDLLK